MYMYCIDLVVYPKPGLLLPATVDVGSMVPGKSKAYRTNMPEITWVAVLHEPVLNARKLTNDKRIKSAISMATHMPELNKTQQTCLPPVWKCSKM